MSLTSASIGERLKAAGPVAANLDAVYGALWRQPHVPVSTLALCWLLLALRHQADAELALDDVKMPAAKSAALKAGSWAHDSQFTPAERAALDFTEYFQVDAQSIPDEAAEAVTRHYGETGLVALIEALCFLDGRIRLALVFSGL